MSGGLDRPYFAMLVAGAVRSPPGAPANSILSAFPPLARLARADVPEIYSPSLPPAVVCPTLFLASPVPKSS